MRNAVKHDTVNKTSALQSLAVIKLWCKWHTKIKSTATYEATIKNNLQIYNYLIHHHILNQEPT